MMDVQALYEALAKVLEQRNQVNIKVKVRKKDEENRRN